MAIEVFAPAKVNLTLHVTGQRADGHHLLDSLVAFAGIGDTVTVAPADSLGLSVDGPMAAGIPSDASNLVIRAARFLAPGRGARIHLYKRLPPASGIGGGSSDAAATLRGLCRLWDLPLPGEVLSLGADVPVCMAPGPQRLRGIGERLVAHPPLPECEVLLVNPGVPVSTPQIFSQLQRRDNPPMPDRIPDWPSAESMADWLRGQRNDLQATALSLCPKIGRALSLLAATGALFHAMSGSGATCFGLYRPGTGAAEAAARRLRGAEPGWWVASGRLL